MSFTKRVSSSLWRALLLGFVCALSGCRPPVADILPPVRVVTASVTQQNIPIYGEYIGVTEASLAVEVRARVDGFLEKRFFVEGSMVAEGADLYQVEATPYQAKYQRALANVESAEAALNKANRDVDRLKPLFEQDAVSQLDYDNAVSDQEQAVANLSAVKADRDESKLDLEYTHIKSPITGLVGESLVDIGGLVGSGGVSLLTTVKQVHPIHVRFNMTAHDHLLINRRVKSFFEKLKAEQEGKAIEGFISITLPDDTEYKYAGEVSFTDPQINPRTGTFAVRAVLPNPDRELLPGQFTKVRIQIDQHPNALSIPEEAMMIEQGGSYVFVITESNRVERRFFVPGPKVDGRVLIDSGLEEGETLVTQGVHKIRHGQTVEVVDENEYRLELEQQATP